MSGDINLAGTVYISLSTILRGHAVDFNIVDLSPFFPYIKD